MKEIRDYHSEHQALMQEWREKCLKQGEIGYFTEDGVVNPEKWFGLPQAKRVVFLLKEAYTSEKNPTDWNEAKWLNGEPCRDKCNNKSCVQCTINGYSFNRIAEWVYYINKYPKGKNELCTECIEQIYWLGEKDASRKRSANLTAYYIIRNCILKDIAIINIKKANGNRKSDSGEIKDQAQAYEDFIIRQLRLIDAGCVVCCGTFNLLSKNIKDFLRASHIRVLCMKHPNRISVEGGLLQLNEQLRK